MFPVDIVVEEPDEDDNEEQGREATEIGEKGGDHLGSPLAARTAVLAHIRAISNRSYESR